MSESTKKPEQAEENKAETAPAEDTKKAEKKASKSSKKNAQADRIAELEKELEKAQQSVKESADNFLRLAAEYDNFRKRSLREKDDIKVRSKTDVVEKLLPVIDNFERAALNAEADAESYRKGVEQIYRQFGAEGDAFDPNIHSAVMHTEDENVGENVIVKVFTKGYKLGDTVIRPAVVQVAN